MITNESSKASMGVKDDISGLWLDFCNNDHFDLMFEMIDPTPKTNTRWSGNKCVLTVYKRDTPIITTLIMSLINT